MLSEIIDNSAITKEIIRDQQARWLSSLHRFERFFLFD